MSRQELTANLWNASNIMRRDDGTNGIHDYIEQMSWMFFLKVFEDLEIRFKSEHQIINKQYQRIIPKDYSWSTWTKKDNKTIIDYIDKTLFPFLSNLTGSSKKDTIALIFSEVRRNKMKSASNLKDVIDIINKINFNNEEDSHILSIFYEDLLVKLGKEGGIAGEFYTPRAVVRLIVEIIDPKLNLKNKNDTRMLDPFCGSCGFLIESFKKIMASGKVNSKDVQLIQKSVFNGFEKKSLPFLVGLMNCILHGLTTPKISRRNSLNDNILKYTAEDKFDYVLTNPPFGGEENKQIQQNFPIKAGATELLALQQIMRRLKPNGKCGVVVPDGLLSQEGISFVSVKKELVENFNLERIISLPPGVFANVTSSGQGPKTSLLFFEKSKPTDEIWYYEVTLPKGQHYTRIKTIQDTDLKDCYEKYNKKIISNMSWNVKVEDIIKKNYDLTAKNPNKKDNVDHKKPSEILLSIEKDEKDIVKILGKLKKEIQS